MKKVIILISTFIIVFFISILIQSYLGNGIKLSTNELPNPQYTYFIENIKHNLGFKFIIALIISTIVTTATGFIYKHKPR